MIDLAEQTTTDDAAAHPRTIPTLAIGLFGGLSLGIAARAWMRLISDKPEFTWGGTIFIVLGFAIFGLAQSIAAIAHRRASRLWRFTIARVIGTIGLIPLFVAAGGVMFPTVVGGGLASARREWRPLTRCIWLVPAAAPVVFVGHDLVGKFGWSVHTVAGCTAMLALYATIVGAARFTFSARPAIFR